MWGHFAGPTFLSLHQSSTMPRVFITVQLLTILLLPPGHEMPCGVENAMPWRVCKQRLLFPALCRNQEPPRAVGCEAARTLERAVGAVASAQPGERDALSCF